MIQFIAEIDIFRKVDYNRDFNMPLRLVEGAGVVRGLFKHRATGRGLGLILRQFLPVALGLLQYVVHLLIQFAHRVGVVGIHTEMDAARLLLTALGEVHLAPTAFYYVRPRRFACLGEGRHLYRIIVVNDVRRTELLQYFLTHNTYFFGFSLTFVVFVGNCSHSSGAIYPLMCLHILVVLNHASQ